MFPHVSTEALVCALVLSEEGTIERTAKRLHTSRSNAGRKLKSFQKGWEVEFFYRSRTGFELTRQGRAAMRELRTGVESLQRAFDRAVYASIRGRKPFRIGYSLYTHAKVLPFLQQLDTPPTGFSHVVMKTDTTLGLIRRVLHGELQAGFGVMPIVDRDLHIESILREGFSVCIPDTHPFKDRVRVSARDLAGETIYWLPRRLHPPLYDEVKNYLLGMGHRVQDLHEARAIIQGIDVAAHGFGVALVPRSAERFQCAHVLFKPLTDKLIGIETALFVRRDSIHGEVGDFVNAAIAKLRPPKTEVQ